VKEKLFQIEWRDITALFHILEEMQSDKG